MVYVVLSASPLRSHLTHHPSLQIKPTPEDEARYGLSVVEETLWNAVPEHYRVIDDALKQIGAAPLPMDVQLITLGSWMGGDRD
eukprot:1198207-Rhodomonas_salina.1